MGQAAWRCRLASASTPRGPAELKSRRGAYHHFFSREQLQIQLQTELSIGRKGKSSWASHDPPKRMCLSYVCSEVWVRESSS